MGTDRLTMQDPRHQYPEPPFPKQPQPVPGLDAKMVPSADHGEQSYTGSGKLTNRKALITGGDSGIGRAVAIGVRVNAIAPGPFWTPLQPSGGQTQDKVEKFGSEVPLNRPGQPVEIAPVYVLLASQEGSYITGEVYGVTGGIGIA
jgi:Enoyl-(Acyl carrier protein) reductase